MKALRRLVRESQRQGGYVVADGERVYFRPTTDRRRAVGIDLGKTNLISADTFPRGARTWNSSDGLAETVDRELR